MTDLTALNEKIESATEASERARERQASEREARHSATTALNLAETYWNEVYKIMLGLWKERHSYPGLDESNLGLLFRSVQYDLNDRPRPIKGHPQPLNGKHEVSE